jgi:hypothetical protein
LPRIFVHSDLNSSLHALRLPTGVAATYFAVTSEVIKDTC